MGPARRQQRGYDAQVDARVGAAVLVEEIKIAGLDVHALQGRSISGTSALLPFLGLSSCTHTPSQTVMARAGAPLLFASVWSSGVTAPGSRAQLQRFRVSGLGGSGSSALSYAQMI